MTTVDFELCKKRLKRLIVVAVLGLVGAVCCATMICLGALETDASRFLVVYFMLGFGTVVLLSSLAGFMVGVFALIAMQNRRIN